MIRILYQLSSIYIISKFVYLNILVGIQNFLYRTVIIYLIFGWEKNFNIFLYNRDRDKTVVCSKQNIF